MKSFQSFTMIKQPLDAVWSAMRDRLPEIAASMDDIDSIIVLECNLGTNGQSRMINRWNAKQQVPTLLQSRLGADSIYWIDRAFWDESTYKCNWTIEPSVLPGHIECSGITSYTSAMAGRGTRVNFEGQFNLSPGFLSGLSGSLEPMIVSFVETIVSSLIPHNLSKAITSAGDLISIDRMTANK